MTTPRFTPYPEGSIRELWSISFPLMISVLASLCLIFTDRVFLAHYSLNALNAVVNAGTLAWAFMGGVGMMTSMSEVFVAQYNGAKQYHRIGVPVWQMIWLSLFSYVLFIPAAYFADSIFPLSPHSELESQFFRYLMCFGPFYAIMTAFAGFFVGKGQTKVLIGAAIVANVLNAALDWLLIFGYPPYIPEMGIKGAAIATSCSYAVQTIILAALFFQKKHRQVYGTDQWQFNLSEFIKCFRIGLPQGIFAALEVFGWTVFYFFMTMISNNHITVSSICQSFLILFSFFADGLSRGVTAIAGNFIGSKRLHLIYRMIRSGLIMQVLFCTIISFLMLWQFDSWSHFLLVENISTFTGTSSEEIMKTVEICLIFSFTSLLFEGVRWIFSGLLTAAGDTYFLLCTGALSVWVGLLVPIYFIIVKHHLAVEYAWLIALIYNITITLIYFFRYRQGGWRKIDLISSQSESERGQEFVTDESTEN